MKLWFASYPEQKMLIWYEDEIPRIASQRLATDADLASMGLCKLSRVEELIDAALVKLKQPDLIEAIKESAQPEPAPHKWEVGDYALCPDGKVRRVEVLGIDKFQCHDGLWCLFPENCTPVLEPEMPELPDGWMCMPNSEFLYDGKYNRSLTAWINFQEGHPCELTDKLLALRDWRILTGRDM